MLALAGTHCIWLYHKIVELHCFIVLMIVDRDSWSFEMVLNWLLLLLLVQILVVFISLSALIRLTISKTMHLIMLTHNIYVHRKTNAYIVEKKIKSKRNLDFDSIKIKLDFYRHVDWINSKLTQFFVPYLVMNSCKIRWRSIAIMCIPSR